MVVVDAQGGDAVNCPDCGEDMGDVHDTTYSNVNTGRAQKGEHTGNIYWCQKCEQHWLDDFLDGSKELHQWNG